MQATGKRKDGRGEMQGTGVWYVTKKGKLCLELTAGGVDENWCRHVFRVGEGYYVSKDLRPDRLALPVLAPGSLSRRCNAVEG